MGICGGFGIGAPAVAVLIEELAAFGVNNFLSIGTAGALQKDLRLGSYVICNKAIRDEGTSYHYLKPEKFSYPSANIMKNLVEVAKDLELTYSLGIIWTIDAPYGETIEEIDIYRKEGVLTVEMEAAAIFAVAKYLNVEAAALFTISDYLCGDKWQLHFHFTEEHLKTLFTIAKKTINSLQY
ncbi:MAG: purine-nucleoside phosphorylase [Promethearchaeota archaeon]|nr:MAG: purine-nucleoside phosphorylase [Candidatus Lokiarchaeota archaeon]